MGDGCSWCGFSKARIWHMLSSWDYQLSALWLMYPLVFMTWFTYFLRIDWVYKVDQMQTGWLGPYSYSIVLYWQHFFPVILALPPGISGSPCDLLFKKNIDLDPLLFVWLKEYTELSYDGECFWKFCCCVPDVALQIVIWYMLSLSLASKESSALVY